MKTRYQQLFHNLYLRKEGCFVPFIILGDPTIEISLKIVDILIENGADALELGIPFSDPMADGPIIQNANLRAFKNGITINKCFEMLHIIRTKYSNIPIGLLLYANLAYQMGINQFYKLCKNIEIDSVLFPDVPIQEYSNFLQGSETYNVSPIFMCPPNADDIYLKKLGMHDTSYVYLLSRSGVTGIHNHSNIILNKLVQKCKKIISLPLLQGFGINSPTQIKNILHSGVEGIICGSAIIKIIENYYLNLKKMFNQLKNFIFLLKESTKNVYLY
ncbi:Tryptophan synthase alpha chain [Buchnera aphidicola (Eriosoma lanigerum)]|uniref:tryptophan synthase subunit alpha n=1 Tax=Buchnera aphidicola TaxID=9 RepID=UPI003463A600